MKALKLKDVLYVIGILLAACSNYLIDKTETNSQLTTLKIEVVEIKQELKETNLGVVLNRLDNVELRLRETNNKIGRLDEKADRILLILAGN